MKEFFVIKGGIDTKNILAYAENDMDYLVLRHLRHLYGDNWIKSISKKYAINTINEERSNREREHKCPGWGWKYPIVIIPASEIYINGVTESDVLSGKTSLRLTGYGNSIACRTLQEMEQMGR